MMPVQPPIRVECLQQIEPRRRERLRRKLAQQIFGTGAHTNSAGGPLITCRTSIGMFIGAPPGAGAAEARAAIA